jgi:hypothetical protein
MNAPAKLLPLVICTAALLSFSSSAQTPERRQASPAPQSQVQQPSVVSADPVANEIGLLRKSLQTLNTRLREISEKLLATDAKAGDAASAKESPIAKNLSLLALAEQRAEGMRKQLIELTEKETAFRTRMMQLDEEMRPESIDRSLSGFGSIRSNTDLRDARRRVLDNERRGVESLLNQTSQSRARLEEDVRQADALVQRFRLKLLPLIEKEIDKIIPD